MTTTFENTTVARRISLYVILSLMALASFGTAQAQQSQTKNAVTYLGKLNGKHVIAIDYTNAEEKTCEIQLQDGEGRFLYVSRFQDARFSKRFLIDQEEPSDVVLAVTVTSGKEKTTQVVQIKSQAFVQDEVRITKL